ncbi:MAG: penicillin-insensitive murein endopeptidase [Deltaproteobacteria bacterium]|nr:penicillin-insensitive murein endopeptidase [Deltaproteobacteria bacterium]
MLAAFALGCAVSRGGDDEPSPTARIEVAPAAADDTPGARGGRADEAPPSDGHRRLSTEPNSADDRAPVRDDGTPDDAAGEQPVDETPSADPGTSPAAAAEADETETAQAGAGVVLGHDPDARVLAPELQPLPRREWVRHRRAPRESLLEIARRYDVSVHRLRQWNDLAPGAAAPRRSKRIKVKARRTPPPREKLEYTVQEGDTWWSVSLRHGVDGRDLRAYNYPYRKKMKPGATLSIWIDPVVFNWIAEGEDPLPPDDARQMRRGALSVGSPNDGVLLNGLRIPDDPGLELRLPRSAYGSSHAVAQLMLAIDTFHERNAYPYPIPIGSMSRPRGGEMGSHLSHQTGRDVDIRLLRRPGISKYRELRGSRIQWDAVWDLVIALAEVDTMVIFLDYKVQGRLYREAKALGATDPQLQTLLQYPRGRAAARGLVRHSPGHDQHLHVRFGCGPYEIECVP